MTPEPDTDVAAVREAHENVRDLLVNFEPHPAELDRLDDKFDVVLDHLAARLDGCQKALREAIDDCAQTETRLQEAERERDEARATALITATAETQKMYREQEARAEAVEAREKALREALDAERQRAIDAETLLIRERRLR